jgi:hypothetical protein
LNTLAKRSISVFATNRTHVMQFVQIHFIVLVIRNIIACHIKNIYHFHVLYSMWRNLEWNRNSFSTRICRGTRWRSWLRHWATSRKVTGSISDCVIGIDIILSVALWSWGWFSL